MILHEGNNNNTIVNLNSIFSNAAPTAFVWTTNGSGSFIPNNTTANAIYIPSPSDTTNGQVTLSLCASNAGGCLSTVDSIIVLISPAPIVNAGSTLTACVNKDTLNLNAIISAGATTGIWSNLGGGQFLPNNTNLNVQWNGSGSISVFETGNLGCALSDTLIFSYTPLLASSIQPFNESGCVPLTLLFDANSANPGPLTHQWIINSRDTFNVKSAEITFDTPGVYTIRYVLNNGICTDTISTLVTVYDDPLANFSYLNAPTSILYYPNDTLFLQNLSSLTNTEYLWDFGDGNTATSIHPAHEYRNAGTYNVQLRVTDTVTGCVSYYSRAITLEVISNVNSPQIFTPNGDGINDKFRIYERNLSNFKILIFDRWGQIIYTSRDPHFEWDGTHNGVECPVGAYVYHIVATGEDNLPYRRTDIVNLVK